MANFFDNMKNKGTTLVEQTKLSGELNGLRSQMQQNYYSLGQMFYDSKRKENGPTEQDMEGLMKTIDMQKSNEKELEKKIALLRGDVLCPKCGAAVKAGSRFCTVCGADMPAPAPVPMAAPPAAGVCKCGAPLIPNMKFCTRCGAPAPAPVAPAPGMPAAGTPVPPAPGIPAAGTPVPPAPVPPAPGMPVPPVPGVPAPEAPAPEAPSVPYGNPEQIHESSPSDKEQG